MFIYLFAALPFMALCVSTSSASIPPWVTQEWAQNSVGLLAGPVTSGGGVWSMMTKSCIETYGESSINGTNCMSDAIYTLLYIATSGSGASNAATDIKNGTTAEKRNPGVSKIPDLTLRSISQGSVAVPGSTTSTYSLRSTLFEHVSNGTHGSVRSVSALGTNDDSKRQSKLRHRRNTFSYGPEVTGLKLSYIVNCSFTPFDDDSLASLRYLAYSLGISASTTIQSDKYALEVYNPVDHTSNHMLATLIAELDGYGSDYEGFPFSAAFSVSDKC